MIFDDEELNELREHLLFDEFRGALLRMLELLAALERKIDANYRMQEAAMKAVERKMRG